jgi:hypothetical protein
LLTVNRIIKEKQAAFHAESASYFEKLMNLFLEKRKK